MTELDIASQDAAMLEAITGRSAARALDAQ